MKTVMTIVNGKTVLKQMTEAELAEAKAARAVVPEFAQVELADKAE